MSRGSPDVDRATLSILFDEMGGPSWNRKRGWKTMRPTKDWCGITVNVEGRVVQVDLGWNSLQGPIPAKIARLNKLERIVLSGNNLNGSIPKEIGKLHALKSLALDHNRLSGSIPPEIGSLTMLTSLSLRDNELSGSVPEALSALTALIYLDVDNNRLRGAPPKGIWYVAARTRRQNQESGLRIGSVQGQSSEGQSSARDGRRTIVSRRVSTVKEGGLLPSPSPEGARSSAEGVEVENGAEVEGKDPPLNREGNPESVRLTKALLSRHLAGSAMDSTRPRIASYSSTSTIETKATELAGSPFSGSPLAGSPVSLYREYPTSATGQGEGRGNADISIERLSITVESAGEAAPISLGVTTAASEPSPFRGELSPTQRSARTDAKSQAPRLHTPAGGNPLDPSILGRVQGSHETRREGPKVGRAGRVGTSDTMADREKDKSESVAVAAAISRWISRAEDRTLVGKGSERSRRQSPGRKDRETKATHVPVRMAAASFGARVQATRASVVNAHLLGHQGASVERSGRKIPAGESRQRSTAEQFVKPGGAATRGNTDVTLTAAADETSVSKAAHSHGDADEGVVRRPPMSSTTDPPVTRFDVERLGQDPSWVSMFYGIQVDSLVERLEGVENEHAKLAARVRMLEEQAQIKMDSTQQAGTSSPEPQALSSPLEKSSGPAESPTAARVRGLETRLLELSSDVKILSKEVSLAVDGIKAATDGLQAVPRLAKMVQGLAIQTSQALGGFRGIADLKN